MPALDTIHHVSLYATEHAKTKRFYEKALKPLGIACTGEFAADWDQEFPGRKFAGFGPKGRGVLWVIEVKKATSPGHLAFSAKTVAEVNAFYKAARAAGGKDNGKPGLREAYGPNYYGAFVIDPDGNNVEAVAHVAAPKGKAKKKK